ncbi:MAG: IS4 family transposase [Chloroflexi bacterium]|nr:IS4 family transposase [Chloroflexota bacterium]
MTTVTQLSKTLQEILTTTANDLARTTGFTQRQSKVTGAVFAQAIVLGWLANAEATLEELTQGMAALEVSLSPQGLEHRFDARAAELLKQLLQRATQHLIAVDPVAIPLLQRFQGVYLQDSTTITLPNELAKEWQGCGGKKDVGESALKVQVQFDLCGGRISHLVLQNGREQDRDASIQTTPLPPGALRLADLGYFSISVFETLGKQGVYWLSRYQAKVKVWNEQEQPLDLPHWLATQTANELDRTIFLSDRYYLPCRLIASRVPVEVAAERRRRLRREARKKGQTVSHARSQLAGWTIFVTNVPVEKLSSEEVLVIGRCRWQIELLFDLWKTHGKVGHSRSTKPWRVLCEVYAKLLAMLIQHWLLLVGCWCYPDRSLHKASKTIQRYACQILNSFSVRSRLEEVIIMIQHCLATGCRINKRKTTPHSFQLLLAFSAENVLA